jgi:hypothetical protein
VGALSRDLLSWNPRIGEFPGEWVSDDFAALPWRSRGGGKSGCTDADGAYHQSMRQGEAIRCGKVPDCGIKLLDSVTERGLPALPR